MTSTLATALPQVVAAILVVFLTLAIGFLIAAYTEATARRLRTPRIVTTTERRTPSALGPLLLPLLLLTLVLCLAIAVGVDF